MQSNDDYQLTTWGNLWKYIGIEWQAHVGFYYLTYAGKVADLKDYVLYWFGLCKNKPPLIGESNEDYYIRRLYSTSYDCFNRPICGPPENFITVALRIEVPIESSKHLVVKNDCTKEALNFGSYNYLGFGGRHPVVTKQIVNCFKNKGVCLTGTSYERGVSEEQEQLEKMLAEFLHKEDAIVVPMGFATNSTLIPILVGSGDVVFSDALNHTSIITGIRSSGAEVKVFKHNDMCDLQKKLEDLKTNGMKNGKQPNRVLIIVEGLYSMEGEYCPLKELIALKKAYGFYLYIDEAHSIGALGDTGRGIVEHLGCDFDDVDILMGTFSKSFASSGGYLASNKEVISLLRTQCYSYVYGSPMSPVCAQQIISAFEMMKTDEGKQRISQLRRNSIRFRRCLKDAGCHVLGDEDSPVIPVMVYHTGKIKDVSRGCLKRGVAIVVVGFPACPANACRVRLCVSASHTDEDIDKAFNVLMECLKETDSIFGTTPSGNIIYHPPTYKIEELKEKEERREMKKLGKVWDDKDNIKEMNIRKKPNGIELSSYDIHEFESNNQRKNDVVNVLMNYGCGSCGPRGFYGTTLEHLDLERKLSQFFGTNDALTYCYGNNTMTSVVPVYGRQGDVILVDEKCNYNIQLGCRLSKAMKAKYSHCDIVDLKTKLNEALKQVVFPQKIIIITEGIFQDDLRIAPLDQISKLRQNNVLLIVDDSLGIGAIGKNLKGTVEHVGLTTNDVDVLCGSLEHVCSSIGGFCVGKFSVLDKQRLFGAGYCFSAAAPPFSCTAGKFTFEKFSEMGERMRKELVKKRKQFNELMKKVKHIEVIGDQELPYVLLNMKDNNQKVVDALNEKGYFTVLQHHLNDDWCDNNYVRLNIGRSLDYDMMNNIVQVLEHLK